MAPMTELTTYLAMLMNGGAHNGKRLVSEESIQTMFTPHIEYCSTYWGMSSYGYGWSILPDFLGEKQVNHGGSLLVATAHLALMPSLGIGVAMAANTSRPPFATIADGVFAALMGRDPRTPPPQTTRQNEEPHWRVPYTHGTWRSLRS